MGDSEYERMDDFIKHASAAPLGPGSRPCQFCGRTEYPHSCWGPVLIRPDKGRDQEFVPAGSVTFRRMPRRARLGAAIGNWNDRTFGGHDSASQASRRWRVIDRLAGWLYTMPHRAPWFASRRARIFGHSNSVVSGRDAGAPNGSTHAGGEQ